MPGQNGYTADALIDVHTRAHRTFQKYFEHCAGLDAALIDREVPAFGYPSIRLQFHHVIGAEEYWLGVIRGNFRVEEDEDRYPTMASLMHYRDQVAAATVSYLRAATPAELNTAREMVTWGGAKRMLVPAHILMRTQTHIYHHGGQIAAMCRFLESPVPAGLDFPLD